jgi:hypothetical protein
MVAVLSGKDTAEQNILMKILALRNVPEITDKRDFERYELELTATIEYQLPEQKRERLILQTTNISAEDVFFHTMATLPEGLQVNVSIYLLVDNELVVVSVSGCVLRPKEIGIAISFESNYKVEIISKTADEESIQ